MSQRFLIGLIFGLTVGLSLSVGYVTADSQAFTCFDPGSALSSAEVNGNLANLDVRLAGFEQAISRGVAGVGVT